MNTAFDELRDQDNYWARNPLGGYVDRVEMALLLDLLQPRPGETIIDSGAGTGRLSRRVAEQGGVRVIAVEGSPSMRDFGKRLTEGLKVEWIDAKTENVPLPDGLADAVVVVGVLEFAPDPEPVIAEARRLVRPGGRLVAAVLSTLSPWAALYRHLGVQGLEPWANSRYYTTDKFAELLGLRDDAVRGVVHLAPAARPPYEEADVAGHRAGNRPAFLAARWDKPTD